MVEFEGLTEEQFTELQEKAGKVEGLETAKTELETAKTDWEAKEKDLNEAANPNWQKARKTIDALKAVAKDKGVEVDDEGNIKNPQQNIDIEEVRRTAAASARNEVLSGKLSEELEGYEPDSAKVIKHFYDKLIVGEDVSLKNMGTFIAQAESAARQQVEVHKTDKFQQFSGGRGPKQSTKDVLDEAKSQEMGEKMGLGFALDNKDKK